MSSPPPVPTSAPGQLNSGAGLPWKSPLWYLCTHQTPKTHNNHPHTLHPRQPAPLNPLGGTTSQAPRHPPTAIQRLECAGWATRLAGHAGGRRARTQLAAAGAVAAASGAFTLSDHAEVGEVGVAGRGWEMWCHGADWLIIMRHDAAHQGAQTQQARLCIVPAVAMK